MRRRRRRIVCAFGGIAALSGCLNLQSGETTPVGSETTDADAGGETTPTETPRPIDVEATVSVPESVSTGRKLETVVQLENRGRKVTGTVRLDIDGSERDERNLLLPSEGSSRLFLFADELAVGTHDLRIRLTYGNGGEQTLTRTTTEVVPGTFTIRWSGATVPAEDVEGNDDTRHLSFGCERFVVADGTDFLTDVDVGSTDDRGLFLDGAHNREAGGSGTFRWLGAPDDETVVASGVDLRVADEVWLDGHAPPKSTGRTATFVVDGVEYETVSVPQDGVCKLPVPDFE
jgi:hypothetical protein